MKLVICTKFQVNRMNFVESRRGGPIAPPPLSRLPVTIFSRRLLGLKERNWNGKEIEQLITSNEIRKMSLGHLLCELCERGRKRVGL